MINSIHTHNDDHTNTNHNNNTGNRINQHETKNELISLEGLAGLPMANLRTDIMDFGGFDSSRILI